VEVEFPAQANYLAGMMRVGSWALMIGAGGVAALLLAGCSPAPSGESVAQPGEWERHPGLLPKPAGRILDPRDAAWSSHSGDAPAEDINLLDTRVAEEEFARAADAGQAWAQTRLGALYARAENDPQQWEKAVRLLELAAQQGDAEAFYELAGLAASGRGLPPSDVQAYKYMTQAAAGGLAEAQYRLAAMYADGRGASQQEEKALDWGRRAAAQDHHQAQFSLGCTLLESSDAERRAEGLHWLNTAADAGSRQAGLFLGTALARGEFGMEKDEIRSEQLLRALSEQDDAEAQFVLAWLYMFGQEFNARREEARVWLERAASLGHDQAAGALAALPPADAPRLRSTISEPRG